MKRIKLILAALAAGILVAGCGDGVSRTFSNESTDCDKAAVSIGEKTIIFNIDGYETRSTNRYKLNLSCGDTMYVYMDNCILINSNTDSYLIRKLCYGGNAVLEETIDKWLEEEYGGGSVTIMDTQEEVRAAHGNNQT